ncbi:MAG: SMP-30/gluconolactonase/LRE family protein [Chloroflexi bacterium]|nr:SMP-30/gluconolactonase/LRE family protein [Chloroflexota bacterium]
MPSTPSATPTAELFQSRILTPPGSFTGGAEGPVVGPDGALYAVNYAKQGTIGRVLPSGEHGIFCTLPEGSTGNGLVLDSRGDLLVADYTGHNILRLNLATRAVAVHAHEPRMNQPNDICITANDIVFASDPNWAKGTGQLWRVLPDGTTTLIDGAMGTTNGIEVSPDERRLYVNESVQLRIWVFDLTAEGEVSNKRLLIQFPDYNLDGMRCDTDGNLYVTRYAKGVVAVISPEGEVLREIALHAKNCSNLAFGGPDGRTCYVTMADAGNVEMFRTPTPGRAWMLAQR